MSRLLFKEDEYTYKELWRLHMKKPNMFSVGTVIDLDTEIEFDIKDFVSHKEQYIDRGTKRFPDFLKDFNTIKLKSVLPDLTDNELGKFLTICHKHLTKKSNTLQTKYISNHYVTSWDIQNTLSLSERSSNGILKILKDKNVIKYIKLNNKKIIVVNPIYILAGDINTISYSLFKEDVDKYFPEIDLYTKALWDIEFLDIEKLDKENAFNTKHIKKITKEMTYSITHNINNTGGIYVLYNKGDIVYIGKSLKNVSGRINQHRKDKEFDSVKCVEFKDLGDIDLYEPYLIKKHKPKYNKEFIGSMNSENILKDISLEEDSYEHRVLKYYNYFNLEGE